MALPQSVPADGNLKVLWVPAIPIPAAPTVADLTDPAVVDLSCYLTPDGYSPGGDEQVANDDRLCSTQTFERPGRSSNTLDLTYIFGGPAVDNKAFTTLKHLTDGFVVTRWGKAYDTAIAAGDLVDVLPATCGRQRKQPPEANSVLKCTQKIFVTGSSEEDVAVAA